MKKDQSCTEKKRLKLGSASPHPGSDRIFHVCILNQPFAPKLNDKLLKQNCWFLSNKVLLVLPEAGYQTLIILSVRFDLSEGFWHVLASFLSVWGSLAEQRATASASTTLCNWRSCQSSGGGSWSRLWTVNWPALFQTDAAQHLSEEAWHHGNCFSTAKTV